MPPRPAHDIDRFCEFDPSHDLTGLAPVTHRCPVCSAPLRAGARPDPADHVDPTQVDAGYVTPIAAEPNAADEKKAAYTKRLGAAKAAADKAAANKKAAATKRAAKTSARKAAATPTHPSKNTPGANSAANEGTADR